MITSATAKEKVSPTTEFQNIILYQEGIFEIVCDPDVENFKKERHAIGIAKGHDIQYGKRDAQSRHKGSRSIRRGH